MQRVCELSLSSIAGRDLSRH